MIKIINSTFTKNGKTYAMVEIHRDGNKVVAFGKRKAQAIVEAIRDKDALLALEEFSGYAQADRDSDTHAAEAADRNKFDESYRGEPVHDPREGGGQWAN